MTGWSPSSQLCLNSTFNLFSGTPTQVLKDDCIPDYSSFPALFCEGGVWRTGPNLIIKYVIYNFNLVAKCQKKQNKCADVRLYEIKPDAAVTNSCWRGLLLFYVTDSAALVTFHRTGAPEVVACIMWLSSICARALDSGIFSLIFMNGWRRSR